MKAEFDIPHAMQKLLSINFQIVLVRNAQPPRHEDDQDRPQSGILFEALANFESANIGQINVGKNEVVILLFGEPQGIGSGGL